MPQFYIHLDNGNGFQKDEVGSEFADFEAARRSAIIGCADILADEIKYGSCEVNLTIHIEDASHHEVFTLPMAAVVGR